MRKEDMSTAKGRRMAFIHILFLYFSFPEACGQGGTIVCEGYYYFFLIWGASPVEWISCKV